MSKTYAVSITETDNDTGQTESILNLPAANGVFTGSLLRSAADLISPRAKPGRKPRVASADAVADTSDATASE